MLTATAMLKAELELTGRQRPGTARTSQAPNKNKMLVNRTSSAVSAAFRPPSVYGSDQNGAQTNSNTERKNYCMIDITKYRDSYYADLTDDKRASSHYSNSDRRQSSDTVVYRERISHSEGDIFDNGLPNFEDIRFRYQCTRCSAIDTGYDMLVDLADGSQAAIHIHDRMTMAEVKVAVQNQTGVAYETQLVSVVEQEKSVMTPVKRSSYRPLAAGSYFSSPLRSMKSLPEMWKRNSLLGSPVSSEAYSPTPSFNSAPAGGALGIDITDASNDNGFLSVPGTPSSREGSPNAFATAAPGSPVAAWLDSPTTTASPTPSTPCARSTAKSAAKYATAATAMAAAAASAINTPSKKSSTAVQLKVRYAPATFAVMNVDLSISVHRLKRKVEKQENVNLGDRRIKIQDKELNEYHNLAFYGIKDGDQLHIVGGQRGSRILLKPTDLEIVTGD